MMILIIGRPDSGKSAFAESMVESLSGKAERKYIATMVPFGEEGIRRVEKHRRLRAGKNFETLECPRNLKSLTGLGGSICLLECMSNLVGNEMYSEKNSGLSQDELCRLICDEVAYVRDESENLVVVANEFSEQELKTCDDETARYIELIHMVNLRLRQLADKTYLKENGEWKIEEVF